VKKDCAYINLFMVRCRQKRSVKMVVNNARLMYRIFQSQKMRMMSINFDVKADMATAIANELIEKGYVKILYEDSTVDPYEQYIYGSVMAIKQED